MQKLGMPGVKNLGVSDRCAKMGVFQYGIIKFTIAQIRLSYLKHHL